MVTKLQEIREKFDIVKKIDDRSKQRVKSFFVSLDGRVRFDDPFEVFYDAICGPFMLDTFNEYLNAREILPLTKEDVEYLYAHKQKYRRR